MPMEYGADSEIVVVGPPGTTGGFEQFRADAVDHAIAVATTPEELLDIAARLDVLGRYLRRSKRLLTEQNAVAFSHAKCLLKLGVTLKEMHLRPGNPQWSQTVTIGRRRPKTLRELGLTKRASATYQRLARIPQALFTAHCREMMTAGKLITVTGLLALERRLEAEAEDTPPSPGVRLGTELQRLRRVVEGIERKGLMDDDDARECVIGTLQGLAEQIERWPLRSTRE
jgi:hypothetical protein